MTRSDEDREVVLQREVPFARELVWRAMTDPRRLDIRDGGARYPNHTVFKEISPPCRLVFDHGDGERVWFEATVILEKTPHGTQVTLRQIYPTKSFRDDVVDRYGAIEGGKQHLAKLEAYVGESLR
jgi:uncharacterized protein YndB with AHSA1/START domain